MDIVKIIFTSIGSLAAMFCITRLIGNRQMSQMSMFDYVNGITVGSIAAEFATSLEQDFWLPLTAMAVYGLARSGHCLGHVQIHGAAPLFQRQTHRAVRARQAV